MKFMIIRHGATLQTKQGRYFKLPVNESIYVTTDKDEIETLKRSGSVRLVKEDKKI